MGETSHVTTAAATMCQHGCKHVKSSEHSNQPLQRQRGARRVTKTHPAAYAHHSLTSPFFRAQLERGLQLSFRLQFASNTYGTCAWFMGHPTVPNLIVRLAYYLFVLSSRPIPCRVSRILISTSDHLCSWLNKEARRRAMHTPTTNEKSVLTHVDILDGKRMETQLRA